MTKRILMVHDYPPMQGGGLEINTFEVSRELVKRGYDVCIATTRGQSETCKMPTPTESEGVKIRILGKVDELDEIIKFYDVVWAQMTFSIREGALYGIKVARERGKRVFVTLHTSPAHIPYSALRLMDVREKSLRIDSLLFELNHPNVNIVVPTKVLRDELVAFGVEGEMNVIQVGVSDFSKSISEKRKDFDIVVVGEVSYLKGVNYVLDAVNRLKKNGQTFSCRIVGGGSELDLVKALSFTLGLESHVHFEGYVDHGRIYQLLKQSKLLVHASLTEVMPLAIIEALVVGTPVIGSDVGMIPEIINATQGGLVFPRGDAVTLSEKMSYLLNNKDERHAMSQRAQLKALELYSLETQVDNIERIIRD